MTENISFPLTALIHFPVRKRDKNVVLIGLKLLSMCKALELFLNEKKSNVKYCYWINFQRDLYKQKRCECVLCC